MFALTGLKKETFATDSYLSFFHLNHFKLQFFFCVAAFQFQLSVTVLAWRGFGAIKATLNVGMKIMFGIETKPEQKQDTLAFFSPN